MTIRTPSTEGRNTNMPEADALTARELQVEEDGATAEILQRQADEMAKQEARREAGTAEKQALLAAEEKSFLEPYTTCGEVYDAPYAFTTPHLQGRVTRNENQGTVQLYLTVTENSTLGKKAGYDSFNDLRNAVVLPLENLNIYGQPIQQGGSTDTDSSIQEDWTIKEYQYLFSQLSMLFAQNHDLQQNTKKVKTILFNHQYTGLEWATRMGRLELDSTDKEKTNGRWLKIMKFILPIFNQSEAAVCDLVWGPVITSMIAKKESLFAATSPLSPKKQREAARSAAATSSFLDCYTAEEKLGNLFNEWDYTFWRMLFIDFKHDFEASKLKMNKPLTVEPKMLGEAVWKLFLHIAALQNEERTKNKKAIDFADAQEELHQIFKNLVSITIAATPTTQATEQYFEEFEQAMREQFERAPRKHQGLIGMSPSAILRGVQSAPVVRKRTQSTHPAVVAAAPSAPPVNNVPEASPSPSQNPSLPIASQPATHPGTSAPIVRTDNRRGKKQRRNALAMFRTGGVTGLAQSDGNTFEDTESNKPPHSPSQGKG